MSSVQFRLFEKGDEYKIVELLKLVFKGWPHFNLNCTPLEHWKWKYEDNPLKIFASAVATMNDEIIGHTGAIFNKCKIGDKILLSEQGADFAVNENYRGQNISSRLFDLKNNYVKETIKSELKFHVTSNPIVIKRNLQRGFQEFPHPIIHYIRVKDIGLHLKTKNSKNKLLNRFGFYVVNSLNKLGEMKSPGGKKNGSDFEINKIGGFDERVDQLWDKVKNSYSFMLERKHDYLNWRYFDKRGGDYLIYLAESGEEVLGFVALRINKSANDYLEGNLVDLVTIPGRMDVAEALLSSSVSLFDHCSLNMVNAWMIKGHPFEKLLTGYGFIDSHSNQTGYFEYLNVDKPSDILNCPVEKFHFQMGDSDWI